MTFAAGGALAGLVLLAPLVLLHLRQRSGQVREVPSLLLWQESRLDTLSGGRRLHPPPLPILLMLQVLALILLVLALAAPALEGGRRRPVTVVVLDDSFWMTAPGAMADAVQQAEGVIRGGPGGAPVRIVLADGSPSVLYRGPASGAGGVLSRVRASAATVDLSQGLAVAAGLLTGPHDRIVLVRAPEDREPTLRTSSGELRTLIAGHPVLDQGIFAPTARCGIGSPSTCEVVATIANTAPRAEELRLEVKILGGVSSFQRVHVGAHAAAQVHVLTGPGEQVNLVLSGSDAVSIDNEAWVTVPGDDDIQRSAAVTVVGMPGQARTLAQAFAAVPGVTLRLETPAGYLAGVARASDLVVLDAALPHGSLPPAAAVMLVDPPRLPGGHVFGAAADSTLSGVATASPLLRDTDLASLTIEPGAARRLSLPPWLAPVLWSPAGPLIAAGDNGRGRLIVTAFQPDGSTLPQLVAFPVLAANIVRWSLGWAPSSAVAGTALRIDALPGARLATLRHEAALVGQTRVSAGGTALTAPAPGIYTLSETGPGVSHQTTLDVNLAAPTAPSELPTDLRTASLRAGRSHRVPLAPWLLAVALVVLASEWVYWSTRRGHLAR